MPQFHDRQVPPHPETHLRLACSAEAGRHGRVQLSAYDGDRLVHFQHFFRWHWQGHGSGQLLMPKFIEQAEAKAAALHN
ncbi:hypothetical protein VQ574_21015 (plasmid) [Stutzerimonas frequens]|uniref:hypothetical protein n=1 Tax=Stutzerimonas frequens TaxID=2968969 RepID=UPI002DBBB53F|nr:hypothetical protein [Stutzerimonas frequens]WRW29420.1 hypothetical protein VQ574_21015 [Stutzerimonas frequens]